MKMRNNLLPVFKRAAVLWKACFCLSISSQFPGASSLQSHCLCLSDVLDSTTACLPRLRCPTVPPPGPNTLPQNTISPLFNVSKKGASVTTILPCSVVASNTACRLRGILQVRHLLPCCSSPSWAMLSVCSLSTNFRPCDAPSCPCRLSGGKGMMI
jgi:hypothetical protein